MSINCQTTFRNRKKLLIVLVILKSAPKFMQILCVDFIIEESVPSFEFGSMKWPNFHMILFIMDHCAVYIPRELNMRCDQMRFLAQYC